MHCSVFICTLFRAHYGNLNKDTVRIQENFEKPEKWIESGREMTLVMLVSGCYNFVGVVKDKCQSTFQFKLSQCNDGKKLAKVVETQR